MGNSIANDDRGRSSGTRTQGPSQRTELPKIDLSTFVLSLSTSALYQMGAVEGPDGDKLEAPNRALAQQTIDTLEMLRDRTRGNLDEEEIKLFDSLLYELRMRFVSVSE